MPSTGRPVGVGETRVLVPVSARTDEALTRLLSNLADHLAAEPGVDVENLAYTLSVGRTHLPMRAALVAEDRADLARKLRLLIDTGGAPECRRGKATSGPESSARGETLEELADAYVAGHDPDWAAVYRDRHVRRIPLPVYPFARDRYWVESSQPIGSSVPHGSRPSEVAPRHTTRSKRVIRHTRAAGEWFVIRRAAGE